MNKTAFEQLTKLAELLTARVSVLEESNKALSAANEQLKSQQKTASVKEQPAAVISDEVAQLTCEKLVKIGALKQEQVQEAKERFMKDASAVHTALVAVIDAQALEKTASDEADLNCGRLVNETGAAVRESSLDAAAHILKLY